jgi:hypothetical protein
VTPDPTTLGVERVAELLGEAVTAAADRDLVTMQATLTVLFTDGEPVDWLAFAGGLMETAKDLIGPLDPGSVRVVLARPNPDGSLAVDDSLIPEAVVRVAPLVWTRMLAADLVGDYEEAVDLFAAACTGGAAAKVLGAGLYVVGGLVRQHRVANN